MFERSKDLRITHISVPQEEREPRRGSYGEERRENELSQKLTVSIKGPIGKHSEKAMASHSSTLAWKIPWTEEPGRLQSMGSLRVGHDLATSLSLFTFLHWRRKWQPTPVFLPGESLGRGAWWAAVSGVAQSRTWLKQLSSSRRETLIKKQRTEKQTLDWRRCHWPHLGGQNGYSRTQVARDGGVSWMRNCKQQL